MSDSSNSASVVSSSLDLHQKIDRMNEEAWEMNRKDPQKAIAISLEARRLSEGEGYKNGIAQALKTMGACYIWVSRNEEAFSRSVEAIILLKELGDVVNEAQVTYNIGTNFFYLADYDNAIRYYMQCYDLNVKIGNKLGMADSLNGAGAVYYTIEENQKARETLNKSRKLCMELGDKGVLLKVMDGLGETCYNLGLYEEALSNYQECIDLIKVIVGASSSPQMEAFALDGMGRTYASMGEPEKALDYYNRSLKIREGIGFKVGIATTYTNIGKLLYKQNQPGQAIEYLEKAYHLAKQINSKEWVYKSTEVLADLCEKQNKFREALEYTRICQHARDEVRNEKANQRSKSIELQHKMEQSESERQLLAKKNTELESYFRDITILSEIGQKIISSLSVEVIVDTVHSNVNTLMDASGFGIGLYREKDNKIIFPAYMEEGTKIRNIEYDAADTNRLAAWCFASKKEVFINDFHAEINNYVKYITKPLVGRSVASLIYIPLTVKDKTLGVITVQSFKGNAYSNYQLNILRNLAVYTSIALENAQIYEQMEETVKQRTKEVVDQKEEIERSYENTRLLSEIGQQLTSTLNFETLFTKLHENVNQLMDAAAFGVRLYDPVKNTVEYKFEIEKGERQPSATVSMDDIENYSVWCIRNRKEIFINDNETEYVKYTSKVKVVTGDFTHSLIFYPMTIGDRVLGVITIQSFKKQAYTPYHLDILKTLASYTAIALENANLYENLEEKIKVRTSEVIKQKEIIEEKNKDITDSIKYAKKIQQALLPNEADILKHLPDSFVYYKPKDIVSGDFYWYTNLGDLAIFAVADCTGHGVPGAFMSAICNDLMNQVIRDEQVTSPGHALQMLDIKLRQLLKKSADQGANDGMDIALCVLNLKTNKLLFSGAHRPLLIMRGEEALEFKPTKLSIGGYNVEDKEFIDHVIQLEKNDIIYLFTDGYTDQFGGPRGKKFKYKQLQYLLSRIKGKSMPDQREMLDKAILDWRADHEQVDDILLLGVRVT